ncbi:thiamine pyrophosphate-binding protein [Nocardia terrae]|uniref:thiamine pyrophosphate-binding protein n=1 Tax=Nocardia terrae TaxID=2675851 RepID=UPI002E2681C3
MSENQPAAPTVADLIIDRVAAHTDHLFGVGGANIEDLYDALHRHPTLTGIIAKHEFGAATMADGYARATARLGVVAATSGGGAMNLLSALTESFDSRVPLLALVGQPPTALEGRGAFQDTSGLPGRLDAEHIFTAVSRYCAKVTSPHDIPEELDRAIAAAYAGGPAVLLLPKDVQTALFADGGGPEGDLSLPGWSPGTDADQVPVMRCSTRTAVLESDSASPPPSTVGPSTRPVASAAGAVGRPERLDEGGASALPGEHSALPDAVDALSVVVAELVGAVPAGGRVVVIAGPEVGAADARTELADVVRLSRASVLVTPDAKDVYSNRDPRFAGVVGVMGHPRAPELIAAAELCLLVGAPLSMTARAGLDAALAACPRVVYLGSEEPFVPVHAEARGSLAALLRDLAASLAAWPARDPGVPAHSWPESIETDSGTVNADPLPGRYGMTKGWLPELVVPPASGPGVRYREAVAALEAGLEPGTDVVADAGNTGAAVVHWLPVPEGGRFLIALGMGGMGYSFGAGIGCALGRGGRTVVIAGDGAYFMHGHELHTAVEYQVPVTFVVFNNNAHAMCVTREQVFYSGEYSFNRFRAAEIGAGVGAMFPELPAWTARTLGEFEHALDKTRAIPGPAFIELQCDPDEIPPFAPFLKEPLA